MKKYLLNLLSFLVIGNLLFAQAPNKMSYQAVIRNSNNTVVSNHAVGMRISILQGTAIGSSVYTETQSPTTNANGLIAIEIGTGTIVSGSFSNIDWANGPYFVKTETDPNGGTNYTLTGTSQLLSVPYALYAKTSTKTDTANFSMNGLPNGASQGQSLVMCDGQLIWVTGGQCPGKISSFNCSDTTHTGLLYENTNANNVQTSISYTGGNGGIYSSQSITSTGVSGLTAVLGSGNLNNGNGKLIFNIDGKPNGIGMANFSINFLGKTCNFIKTIYAVPPIPPLVYYLNSNNGIIGYFFKGTSIDGIYAELFYSNGNGIAYPAQSVNSTGVSGLIASYESGVLNNGSGIVKLRINGIPSDTGIAFFNISLGSKTISLSKYIDSELGTYKAGTVNCTSTPTEVVGVISPNTGRTWMDRNLGASRAAINKDDTLASGDLYQWGRAADGHQCRNSPTTTTTSSIDKPNHNKFILNQNYPFNWRVPPNRNLWQEDSKINNPCPIGYRLPSREEFQLEKKSIDFLKFSKINFDRINQSFNNYGQNIWSFSNNQENEYQTGVTFNSEDFNYINPYTSLASGNYVRCIKSQVVADLDLLIDSIQVIGNLIQGINLNNIIVNIPYNNGNGGVFGEKTIISNSSPGISAYLQSGSLNFGNGKITLIISGKSETSGMKSFKLDFNNKSYEFYLNFSPAPNASLNTLTIDSTLNSGIIIQGVNYDAYTNITTTTINYTGGNAGSFDGFNVPSTNVTGLTAIINAGILNNGNGIIVVKITGTPTSSGIANFNFNFAGKTCQFSRRVYSNGTYKSGTVFCNGTPTAVVDVTNPITGKIWMDRNLGASQVATNSTDAAAYGDLYQWGRGADGHQCRNSANTTTISSLDQPANSYFIIGSGPDWRSPQNNNLWQGINGTNNPCPIGYRIPTYNELDLELNSWSQKNSFGAFASSLKFTKPGYRNYMDGFLAIGSDGYIRSSTVYGNIVWSLIFGDGYANMDKNSRIFGFSVRCIKD
jgi:hypothetical protein